MIEPVSAHSELFHRLETPLVFSRIFTIYQISHARAWDGNLSALVGISHLPVDRLILVEFRTVPD